MKLTWRIQCIDGVQWADQMGLEGGILGVRRADLERELLQDERLAAVDLELVAPGESCRILPVFDIVEPRAKNDPGGRDFPGVLTPVRLVGEGGTRVLRGMAVEILDPSPPPNRVPILDLQTEGCRYAGLHHLVIVPTLRSGLDVNERCHTLRLASLRAATFLARHVDGEPDEEQAFELTPAAAELPRVAYV
ncbi:MAG TPA: glycine/sarcosine/betaine reductase component B subunit, partial [Chloroflexota bacterium]